MSTYPVITPKNGMLSIIFSVLENMQMAFILPEKNRTSDTKMLEKSNCNIHIVQNIVCFRYSQAASSRANLLITSTSTVSFIQLFFNISSFLGIRSIHQFLKSHHN